MGIPVIVSPFGFPVRPVERNAPLMTVSSNRFGVPIMLTDRGVPFVVEGLTPPEPPTGELVFNGEEMTFNGEIMGFNLTPPSVYNLTYNDEQLVYNGEEMEFN